MVENLKNMRENADFGTFSLYNVFQVPYDENG